MTFRGTVKGGVVVLEQPSALPEGTPVTISPVEQPIAESPSEPNSIWRKMVEIGRNAESAPSDLPDDLAENHFR